VKNPTIVSTDGRSSSGSAAPERRVPECVLGHLTRSDIRVRRRTEAVTGRQAVVDAVDADRDVEVLRPEDALGVRGELRECRIAGNEGRGEPERVLQVCGEHVVHAGVHAVVVDVGQRAGGEAQLLRDRRRRGTVDGDDDVVAHGRRLGHPDVRTDDRAESARPHLQPDVALGAVLRAGEDELGNRVQRSAGAGEIGGHDGFPPVAREPHA
jgi:hypothetical protein